MNAREVCYTQATELASLIRRRALSPVELGAPCSSASGTVRVIGPECDP
jgi:hypothetical protein